MRSHKKIRGEEGNREDVFFAFHRPRFLFEYRVNCILRFAA